MEHRTIPAPNRAWNKEWERRDTPTSNTTTHAQKDELREELATLRERLVHVSARFEQEKQQLKEKDDAREAEKADILTRSTEAQADLSRMVEILANFVGDVKTIHSSPDYEVNELLQWIQGYRIAAEKALKM